MRVQKNMYASWCKNIIKEWDKVKIRELRKVKKLTLHKLSELSGVSVTQIQAVETGKIKIENMTVKNFMALCKALEVEPGEVYGGEEIANQQQKEGQQGRISVGETLPRIRL